MAQSIRGYGYHNGFIFYEDIGGWGMPGNGMNDSITLEQIQQIADAVHANRIVPAGISESGQEASRLIRRDTAYRIPNVLYTYAQRTSDIFDKYYAKWKPKEDMKIEEKNDNGFTTDYICTHSGLHIYPLEPEKCHDKFSIDDIAHALAHCCRYNGHTPKFYSVAEHSVLASKLWSLDLRPEWRLMLLLHDASEAYLSDVPRPLKTYLPDYNKFEERLLNELMKAFNLGEVWRQYNSLHKDADMIMLAIEKRDMFPDAEWTLRVPKIGREHGKLKVRNWTPEVAKQKFLERYKQLVQEMNTKEMNSEQRSNNANYLKEIMKNPDRGRYSGRIANPFD